MWGAVLFGAAVCYALKAAGLSLPDRVLEQPRVRRVADALPVALLVALATVQTLTTGSQIVVDARLAGLAAAVVALRLRAPFLLVVGIAGGVTALTRAAG